MNLSPRAMLVLVGWYLMLPPVVNAPYKIDTEAPLNSWKIYQAFDTGRGMQQVSVVDTGQVPAHGHGTEWHHKEGNAGLRTSPP
jgi:hypothetical protein